MARAKKSAPAQEFEETFDDVAEPAAAEAPSEPAAEAPQGYRVGKWAELDNYECERCPFATLELPRILEHVAREHP